MRWQSRPVGRHRFWKPRNTPNTQKKTKTSAPKRTHADKNLTPRTQRPQRWGGTKFSVSKTGASFRDSFAKQDLSWNHSFEQEVTEETEWRIIGASCFPPGSQTVTVWWRWRVHRGMQNLSPHSSVLSVPSGSNCMDSVKFPFAAFATLA